MSQQHEVLVGLFALLLSFQHIKHSKNVLGLPFKAHCHRGSIHWRLPGRMDDCEHGEKQHSAGEALVSASS